MHIEISQRLKAFSHEMGARFFIPWLNCNATVYPAYLELENGKQYALPFKSPLEQFTTLLDLEKGKLEIFGQGSNGYFRVEPLKSEFPTSFIPKEKLSFGCHKEQNWNKMLLRNDPAELLPHWHRLAQWVGDITEPANVSYPNLFDQYTLCFEEYFVRNDDLWKKMASDAPSHLGSQPLVNGAALLRSMLMKFENNKLCVLNHLPESLVCGRYLNGVFPWGTLDLEWSKGLVRRMIIRPDSKQEIQLCFPKSIKTFRVHHNLEKQNFRMKNLDLIVLEPKREYYFDRFEK